MSIPRHRLLANFQGRMGTTDDQCVSTYHSQAVNRIRDIPAKRNRQIVMEDDQDQETPGP